MDINEAELKINGLHTFFATSSSHERVSLSVLFDDFLSSCRSLAWGKLHVVRTPLCELHFRPPAPTSPLPPPPSSSSRSLSLSLTLPRLQATSWKQRCLQKSHVSMSLRFIARITCAIARGSRGFSWRKNFRSDESLRSCSLAERREREKAGKRRKERERKQGKKWDRKKRRSYWRETRAKKRQPHVFNLDKKKNIIS